MEYNGPVFFHPVYPVHRCKNESGERGRDPNIDIQDGQDESISHEDAKAANEEKL